jgi:hypothetical protein
MVYITLFREDRNENAFPIYCSVDDVFGADGTGDRPLIGEWLL